MKKEFGFLRSTSKAVLPTIARQESIGEIKGHLHKRSPRFFMGWQERYFVLKERKLTYFLSESGHIKDNPKGILNFDLIEAAIHWVDKRHFK